MIICTGCGTKNGDKNRFCEKCNKKLQSSRKASAPEDPRNKPLGKFQHAGVPQDIWLSIRRMLEAWAYIIVLGGVFGACLHYQIWWPLYPAVGLLALLFWFRRI